jgi:hypothetical protein
MNFSSSYIFCHEDIHTHVFIEVRRDMTLLGRRNFTLKSEDTLSKKMFAITYVI